MAKKRHVAIRFQDMQKGYPSCTPNWLTRLRADRRRKRQRTRASQRRNRR